DVGAGSARTAVRRRRAGRLRPQRAGAAAFPPRPRRGGRADRVMADGSNPRGIEWEADMAIATIEDIVRTHGVGRPQAPVSTIDGHSLTWAEMDARSNRVANA